MLKQTTGRVATNGKYKGLGGHGSGDGEKLMPPLALLRHENPRFLSACHWR
jgi:hypothetical protein